MTTENKIAVQIKQSLVAKSTKSLMDYAKLLMNDVQDGAGVVFVCVLDVLEDRMSEVEYVDFCDSL